MALKDNPFYLLNVSCTAKRREIVSASDEMSFLLDQDICQMAQTILLNPAKRLSAEMNWFVDADEERIQRIRSCIQNNKPISDDGLFSLSKLNAILYNFSLANDTGFYEIENTIKSINKAYATLDAEELTESINKKRAEANLSPAQSRDIQTELGRKREEIRQLISEKLSAADEDAYIQIVTRLAEEFVADNTYTNSIVLSDVIDQYEIKMQSVLVESTEAIKKHIARITNPTYNANIPIEIETLIREVKKWDKLAQPLQLKSQASGMPHVISEGLGKEIRDLALFLNNEKGLAKEASVLVNAMKSVFAELGVLSTQLQSDSVILDSLLKAQKNTDEIISELKALEKEAEDIKSKAEWHSVNAFVNHIKVFNQHLNAFDLDTETRTMVRENLCLMARATAIDLHNTKRETAYALFIANALVEEFNDLPTIIAKLNDDVAILSRQLLPQKTKKASPGYPSGPKPTAPSSNRSSSSSSSRHKGCLLAILVLLGICAIMGIGSHSASPNRPSSSYGRSSSATYTAKPVPKSEKVYSSASVIGDNVYVNITLIEPEYGVYTAEKYKAVKALTTYHDYVCKCTTESGDIVWVNFNASDYRKDIDSSIESLVSSSSSGFNGKSVRFSPAARLHGKVVRASSVMSDLDKRIEQTSLIEYSSIDIPKQIINTTTSIYIKSIFPSYTITSGSSNEVTHVLCESFGPNK